MSHIWSYRPAFILLRCIMDCFVPRGSAISTDFVYIELPVPGIFTTSLLWQSVWLTSFKWNRFSFWSSSLLCWSTKTHVVLLESKTFYKKVFEESLNVRLDYETTKLVHIGYIVIMCVFLLSTDKNTPATVTYLATEWAGMSTIYQVRLGNRRRANSRWFVSLWPMDRDRSSPQMFPKGDQWYSRGSEGIKWFQDHRSLNGWLGGTVAICQCRRGLSITSTVSLCSY